LPFFNYGGVLGTDDEVALMLMEEARDWASLAGCAYVEFRDVCRRPGAWSVRTDKVGMILELPDTFGELGKQLGSKLRSQVNRAARESPEVRVGGSALLPHFYSVFAHNMRDLGTPVYPVRFFAAILDRFSGECQLVVISRRGIPHAAALLVFHGAQVEVPWAACSAESRVWGFNMKLYWESLAVAIDRGVRRFDFGRSTVGSGTFNFKKQWGASPVQLHWHRWERHRTRNNKMMEYAAGFWRRLPLRVANAIGPMISPYLPW
jgi:FemAB-related protein (PEP-CTERM system-associated)